jgi:hypothetical protein
MFETLPRTASPVPYRGAISGKQRFTRCSAEPYCTHALPTPWGVIGHQALEPFSCSTLCYTMPVGGANGGFRMQAHDVLRWLAEWFPVLLLLTVWLVFMWYLRRPGAAQDMFAEQKRHNAALEKILADYGARIQKLENRKDT